MAYLFFFLFASYETLSLNTKFLESVFIFGSVESTPVVNINSARNTESLTDVSNCVSQRALKILYFLPTALCLIKEIAHDYEITLRMCATVFVLRLNFCSGSDVFTKLCMNSVTTGCSTTGVLEGESSRKEAVKGFI